MKNTRLLTCSIIALSFATASAEETLKEKTADALETAKEKTAEVTDAAVKGMREAWKKSKAYLSQDKATNEQGAAEKLRELGAEIEKLKAESQTGRMAGRAYFQTRLTALIQHHDFAVKALGQKMKAPAAAANDHDAFDNTLEDLENAVNQAQAELRNHP